MDTALKLSYLDTVMVTFKKNLKVELSEREEKLVRLGASVALIGIGPVMDSEMKDRLLSIMYQEGALYAINFNVEQQRNAETTLSA